MAQRFCIYIQLFVQITVVPFIRSLFVKMDMRGYDYLDWIDMVICKLLTQKKNSISNFNTKDICVQLLNACEFTD